MKKVLYISICSLVLLSAGCKRIPVLENGEEVVAEINNTQMTATALYEMLKTDSGTTMLIEYFDTIMLDEMYPDSDEIDSEVDNYLEYIKTQYGEDFSSALESEGFENEADFKATLKLDIKRQKAILDYAKSLVKDKDINNYYEDTTKGDIKASHILISPDVLENATTEEQSIAEAAALEEAKGLITRLNNGENFAELAKEYSDDAGSGANGGDLGYFNTGAMVEEFETATYALNVNEYTKKPVQSQFGYHIILLVDKKEKPELELVKADIIETLAEEKLTENTSLQYEALIETRKAKGFTIYDSELEKIYNQSNKDILNN